MKKKSTFERYEIGQTITVEIHKPLIGKFPIGRTDSGLICILEKGSKGKFQYNSVWDCEVIEVRERSLLIKAIEMTVSAAANEFEAAKKLALLITPTPKKHIKEKPHYQFQSKVEQRKTA